MDLRKGIRPLARRAQSLCSNVRIANGRTFLSSTICQELDVTKQPSNEPDLPPPNDQSHDAVSSKLKNPTRVNTPVEERKLFRRQGLMPIGSRRRRAALSTTSNIPFSQLPYQCFQEARKFLQEDRSEKLEQIRIQRERIERLRASEVAPQDEARKDRRLHDMQTNLEELKILADSNDPLVKKRFEDGMGDMNKPIYRHLADKKWRSYKRAILMQRIEQMNVVPDVFPKVDPTVSTVLSFGRHKVEHGAFVDSLVSEHAPQLNIQCYDKGPRLVTIAVITPDVPDVAKDGFEYRCHFLASNIEISPTATRVDLSKLDEKSQVILPWLPAYAQKGAPYHRMSIFILQQSPLNKSLSTPTHEIDVAVLKESGRYTERDGFVLRSFVDKYQLNPVGVDLFRTQWDAGTAEVMERSGIVGSDVEFKRKRIEPLPYKRKNTERYR